jgi:hypothetical protein
MDVSIVVPDSSLHHPDPLWKGDAIAERRARTAEKRTRTASEYQVSAKGRPRGMMVATWASFS